MRNCKGRNALALTTFERVERRARRNPSYGMRRTAYLSSTTTEAFYAELGFAYFALEMEKNAWM